MQQSRNHLIFFLVVLLLVLGWFQFSHYLFPAKKKVEDDVAKVEDKDKKEPKKPLDAPLRQPLVPRATPDEELISLGSDKADSDFNLFVRLDPLGGGVRRVLLNKFKGADDDGRPTGLALDLVPDHANRETPAFLLYHYDINDSNANEPLDTLGRVKWEVVKTDGEAVVEGETAGKKTQQVAFRRTIQGVTITKTFTLTEGDYHIGLKVDMHRPKGGPGVPPRPADKDAGEKEKRLVKFRYQLAGARGLPVEGKWYTSVFRNAYIARQTDNGSVYRDLQELRQISVWGGGGNIDRTEEGFLRYAGVAVQYFASVIVVDDQQAEQQFLRRARATLETGVVKGKLKKAVQPGDNRVVLVSEDPKNPDDITVHLPPDLRTQDLPAGQTVAIVYQPLSYDPLSKQSPWLAVSVRTGADADATHALWEDDITVRVNTETIELEAGQTATHSYLLYHGPVKPSLLRHLQGDRKVDHDLITRYADTLHLNTMTDYPSPAWPFGPIGRWTGFSWLVIQCTNILHRVLGWLTYIVPSYGLCILILTVLVRGLMFPLSRKQAMMGIKMQALGPEVKKLAEKYKDDQQARGQAMMELYRKHGVNPLGSCWIMLLQMPVFMGLYFALQESIQFRLAPFWPTWIVNLAAPDMMIYWTRSIPLISSDASFGGILYLGPYLNLLPIVAVVLMMIQQKMMTPPPADEQQEMQQKMMKWMMVVMCLMFYKVAAGLCIYFIASSLWGFAERQLLPKAKKPEGTPADDDKTPPVPVDRATSQQITTRPATTSAVTTKKAGRNKRKDRQKAKEKEKEEPTRLGKLRQRVSDWWNDVLEQARKK
jgi:YidC/Oxa1 family membrane protein insertase